MIRETLQPTAAETEIRETRIPVFLSGVPREMAILVGEALVRRDDFDVLPIAMTSARHKYKNLNLGEKEVRLIDYCPFDLRSGTIAVDFTIPKSAALNALHYTCLGIPFVMGTTEGNRQQIEELVKNSQISAVIAPNMDLCDVEVEEEITAQVEGQQSDVEGILMSIRFLARKMKEGSSGEIFTVSEVIEDLRRQA